MQKEVESFNKVQAEVRKELVEFNEKLAQHSVAIISLTIPFIGFLSSRGGEEAVNFSQSFLFFPLYLFLFVGWFCLVGALIFGASYRKRSADYSYSVATLELMNTLQAYNISTFKEEEMSKRKQAVDQFFYPIGQANRFLLGFFVAGIVLILLFVFGSTSQLMKVDFGETKTSHETQHESSSKNS